MSTQQQNQKQPTTEVVKAKAMYWVETEWHYNRSGNMREMEIIT